MKLEAMLDDGQIVTAVVNEEQMEQYMGLLMQYDYLAIPLITDGSVYQFAMYPRPEFVGVYN